MLEEGILKNSQNTVASMETSLHSQSFSYSWLANLKPSSSSSSSSFEIDSSLISSTDHYPSDHDEASFIEMDPRLPPSKRFMGVSSDFAFDFPVSDSSLGLVHADELISNGIVVPLFVKDVKMDNFDMEDYCMTTASSKKMSESLRRCKRLSKRFFQKYMKLLLRPLLYRRRRGHCSNLINRNWEFSAATSPRTSVAYSGDDNWRRSCDSETSIIEAVLHCKRTHQGK